MFDSQALLRQMCSIWDTPQGGILLRDEDNFLLDTVEIFNLFFNDKLQTEQNWFEGIYWNILLLIILLGYLKQILLPQIRVT